MQRIVNVNISARKISRVINGAGVTVDEKTQVNVNGRPIESLTREELEACGIDCLPDTVIPWNGELIY
jgi:hypothetical protein